MDIELFLSQEQIQKITTQPLNIECKTKCIDDFDVSAHTKNTLVIEVADQTAIRKIKYQKQPSKNGVSIYLTGSGDGDGCQTWEIEESQVMESLKDRSCPVKLICYNQQTYETAIRILKIISSLKPVNPEDESLLPDASEIPSGLMSRVKQSPQETYDPLMLEKQVLAASHIVLKNKEIIELRKAVNKLHDDLSKAHMQIDKLRDLLSNEKENDEKQENVETIKKKRRVNEDQKGTNYVQVKCRRLEDYRVQSESKLHKYRQEILELERSKFVLEDELYFYKYGGAMYRINGNL